MRLCACQPVLELCSSFAPFWFGARLCCGTSERWKKRCRVPLGPAAAGLAKDGGAILAHLGHQLAGRSCLLVLRAPEQKFQKNRRELDTFLREPVVDPARVSFFRFGGNDSGCFKFFEPGGKNVGGDAFTGVLELFEGGIAADHEVADDEQRPAVAELFECDADRTAGTSL